MFARNWSEELVAEWLSWKGFAVSIGVPAGSGRGGGRREADVIGFKFEGDKFVIEHWEISAIYMSGEGVINIMTKKFSSNRVEAIKNMLLRSLA